MVRCTGKGTRKGFGDSDRPVHMHACVRVRRRLQDSCLSSHKDEHKLSLSIRIVLLPNVPPDALRRQIREGECSHACVSV